MKLLAFAASNSKSSINRQLVDHATQLISNAEIEIIDLNDYEMPLFSVDREQENGIPELAHAFFEKIGQADGLLISFAEHNGSYTAAFKNLFDWTSRIDPKVFQQKPTVMLSTSPGPGGASSVLATATTAAPFFGAQLLASLSVPSFYQNFDVDKGILTNADLRHELAKAMTSFAD